MSGDKEYRTMELDKIAEENMEDSMKFVNPYKTMDNGSGSRVERKVN